VKSLFDTMTPEETLAEVLDGEDAPEEPVRSGREYTPAHTAPSAAVDESTLPIGDYDPSEWLVFGSTWLHRSDLARPCECGSMRFEVREWFTRDDGDSKDRTSRIRVVCARAEYPQCVPPYKQLLRDGKVVRSEERVLGHLTPRGYVEARP
jgi:hypothetical protein